MNNTANAAAKTNENEATSSEKRKRAVEYLRMYGYVHQKVEDLLERCERLDSQLVSVTQRYDSYPGGSSSKSDIGDIVAMLDSVHASAKEKLGQMQEAEAVFDELLDCVALSSPKAATVLRKRFMVVGKETDYETIADEMNYGVDNVKKLCISGLDSAAVTLGITDWDAELYTFLHAEP